MSSTLYISYDGMLEPLGQSQVLAYLERLSAQHSIHLLSFEKAEDWADAPMREAVRRRISLAGIHWHPRRYHKRPTASATAYDVMMGIATGLWLVLRYRIRLVHARSYVPAVMALLLKRLAGVRFIFDMRGFWADERVDGGLWQPASRLYRMAKWFERQFLLNADHVVSLTHAAVSEMQQFEYLRGRLPPITVIPTCADLERFRPPVKHGPGLVVGYVGSAGSWHLFDAAVQCFAEILRLEPKARLLVLNRNEHAYIRERLLHGGVPLEAVELHRADHAEVPQQMARMHAGIFFYKPSFSRAACAPTKLGEFLGCGIPCLSNAGVGDMAQILESERVGAVLSELDVPAFSHGVQRLLTLMHEPGIQNRCVAAAQRHFSLEEGVRRYLEIYQHGKRL
jgi:glycosyltransferase involved in cell wall biosynthesis